MLLLLHRAQGFEGRHQRLTVIKSVVVCLFPGYKVPGLTRRTHAALSDRKLKTPARGGSFTHDHGVTITCCYLDSALVTDLNRSSGNTCSSLNPGEPVDTHVPVLSSRL